MEYDNPQYTYYIYIYWRWYRPSYDPCSAAAPQVFLPSARLGIDPKGSYWCGPSQNEMHKIECQMKCWHVKCNWYEMQHSPSALTSVWSWHSSSGSSSGGGMLFPENSKRSNCPFFDSFSATNAQIDLDGFSTVRALEIRMKSSSISRIQHRETRRRSPTRRSHQPASGAPSWWPRWSNSGIGQVGALMGKMICLPISCSQYPKARSFCIWFILRWSDTQPFSNLCDFGLDVLQLIFDSFS